MARLLSTIAWALLTLPYRVVRTIVRPPRPAQYAAAGARRAMRLGLLEPGEQVLAAGVADIGYGSELASLLTPWGGGLSLLTLGASAGIHMALESKLTKRYWVVVTDQRVLLIRLQAVTFKDQQLEYAASREKVRAGPVEGSFMWRPLLALYIAPAKVIRLRFMLRGRALAEAVRAAIADGKAA